MYKDFKRNPIVGGLLLGMGWALVITYLWGGNFNGMAIALILFSLVCTVVSEYLLRRQKPNVKVASKKNSVESPH